MGSILDGRLSFSDTAVGAVSRQGVRRKNNQDAFIIDTDLSMYIVADGVGSLAGGEVASAVACTRIADLLERQIDRIRIDAESDRHVAVQSAIRKCFRDADRTIVREQSTDPLLSRMATTALLAYVDVDTENENSAAAPTRNRLYVANVGDSRALLLRDGEVTQLTHDHTISVGLRDAGIISEEQARRHPDANTLYMYLGGAIFDGPEISSCPVFGGDRVVLMTDGITRPMDNQLVADLVTSVEDAKLAAIHVADAAMEHGSGDDVTCLVVDVCD